MQLTHCADHQHFPSLHMDNIRPNERAQHSDSFVYSCTPRSAAALSVEHLYVGFFRLLYTRPFCSLFCDRVDRLESEHLGNMDQYRVTREVPLPYSVDELAYETDGGDDDDRTLIRSGRSSKSRSK